MLFSAKAFLKCYDSAFCWRNYRRSMAKRRPGSELRHNAFGRHVRKHCFVYGDVFGSAIFGAFETVAGKTVFSGSHYAPATNRSGLSLLKKLAGDTDFPAAFAVTEDLAQMLIKAGFRDAGLSHTAFFRGHPVQKRVFVNFEIEEGIVWK